MTLHTYTGGMAETNSFILAFDNDTCLVIDASDGVADFLKEQNLKPTALLLTHQHFDHVDHARALQDAGAKVYAFQKYAPEIIMEDRLRAMGMPVNIPPYDVSVTLEGQTEIEVAGLKFSLGHVPGHSPDSLFFHLPSENFVFSGDLVMFHSIGRTDLPGGNHDQLMTSIREKLYQLPDETAIFPGHGPSSTIATEKLHNQACPA